MSCTRNRVTLSRGFSLLEVLVVMMVLGIVGLLAATRGTAWGDGAAERAAASQLAGIVERARGHALAGSCHAAVVLAGPDAGDAAWRRVAIVRLKAPASGQSPESAVPFQIDTTEDEGFAMPWVDLPEGMVVFGRAQGSPLPSAVDTPGDLAVPLMRGQPPVACKAVIFNPEGVLVHPGEPGHRVLRVGPGEGSGAGTMLTHPAQAGNLPAISIERLTGRVRVIR